MDLGLSDEQRQLVDSFTNLLAKASTPEHVRAAEPGGVGSWTAFLTGLIPNNFLGLEVSLRGSAENGFTASPSFTWGVTASQQRCRRLLP